MLSEKLRVRIMDPGEGNAIPVTSSIGVSQIGTGETWETWVERSDAAMYRAKNNGRNRVETDYGNPENLASVTPAKNFVQLRWHESYDCGHPVIDEQHRGLFERANSLISAMINDVPVPEISKHLGLLLTDAVTHFRDEEAILEEILYPDLEGHKKIHQKLVSEALELYDQLISGHDVM
jgi:hemerythrin-like metal-binding protein